MTLPSGYLRIFMRTPLGDVRGDGNGRKKIKVMESASHIATCRSSSSSIWRPSPAKKDGLDAKVDIGDEDHVPLAISQHQLVTDQQQKPLTMRRHDDDAPATRSAC